MVPHNKPEPWKCRGVCFRDSSIEDEIPIVSADDTDPSHIKEASSEDDGAAAFVTEKSTLGGNSETAFSSPKKTPTKQQLYRKARNKKKRKPTNVNQNKQ